ncbi:TPA: ferrous iron transport protein B [bacterium]|nr:ferrous iron transport protein B [bacterium]
MEKNITIALAGNPNSGKTTVFNNLTGAHQHVGNWAGVTVEKKEGTCKYNDIIINVVDLPGTYSLTTYSPEELIARNFIMQEKPDVVVDIVDASNLERNLYLTAQLMELNANIVIALNMMDVAETRGFVIDVQKMSELLGIPVVPMIASKNKGTQELLKAVIEDADKGLLHNQRNIYYGREIEEEIEKIKKIIDEKDTNNLKEKYSSRLMALKLLENDDEFIKLIDNNRIMEVVKESTEHLKEIFGCDVESVIVDRRYGFVSGIGTEVIKRTGEERHTRSDQIDRVLTNTFIGVPIFLFMMWIAFQLTFKVGAYPTDWIDHAISWLSKILAHQMSETWYRSLILDGIIGGVGGVIVLLPNIFILFFVISVLEDSGYMARAAFIMDSLMHRLGLHGKSFIPMLMGFGCNVPAIMATRTLESRTDRLLTILLIPLMSCSARLPVYALLTSAFFPNHAGSVIFSLYLLGIILAILVGRLFRKTLFRTPMIPLIIELPPYRIPTVKGTFIHVWERGSQFLKKVWTVVLAGVIIIWFLGTFPVGVEYASEASYAGQLGHIIEPIVEPLGADWRGGVALLFGFVAKEIVVATMGVLYGTGEDQDMLVEKLQSAMTPLSAYAFMVATLIYIPCLATVAVIKKETASWRWTLFAVGYGLALAWILATLVYQTGLIIGLS